MTLVLTEQEAKEQIINGLLKITDFYDSRSAAEWRILMPSDNQKPKNITFFKDLLRYTASKWYYLLCLLAVGLIAALLYSNFIVTPLYVSTGKIYIQSKEEQTMTTSELAISTSLTKDYADLIVDRAILNIVADEMDHEYSYNYLKNAISVENPEGTRFIEITVKTPDPADSKQIVDSLLTVSQEKIVDWLGIDRITVIRTGSLAAKPSVPNIPKNLLRGAAAAVIAFLFLAFALYFFNDSIKDASDVEKYLELSVLGNIPFNQSKLHKSRSK